MTGCNCGGCCSKQRLLFCICDSAATRLHVVNDRQCYAVGLTRIIAQGWHYVTQVINRHCPQPAMSDHRHNVTAAASCDAMRCYDHQLPTSLRCHQARSDQLPAAAQTAITHLSGVDGTISDPSISKHPQARPAEQRPNIAGCHHYRTDYDDVDVVIAANTRYVIKWCQNCGQAGKWQPRFEMTWTNKINEQSKMMGSTITMTAKGHGPPHVLAIVSALLC
jgi:hypothetical protein